LANPESSLYYKSPEWWLNLALRPNVINLTPTIYTGLMAVSGSRQNVIKLTLALSYPTILVGRQIEKEMGGGEGGYSGGGREAFHRLIQLK